MRIEEDFMGKVDVPDDAYYGSFTARAKSNFDLSGIMVHPRLIKSVALIKKCAAMANSELGVLNPKIAKAIIAAAQEVIDGKLDKEFVLDAFQAGAGTPLHMNVNEVLANRAEELLGGRKGDYALVHPNNHVNMGQSSNDVIPSAIKITVLDMAAETMKKAEMLRYSLLRKSKEYEKVLKIGRTHLQDAVPLTYGQTFKSYARAVEKDRLQIQSASECLREIGVGGTAIGSGIAAHPKMRELVVFYLKKEGIDVTMAKDCFEITQDMNDFITLSAAFKRYSVSLSRIANDLRLLASGPKAGIAEIVLPEVEPGSSIMPGKVNPSVPEAVNMVCFQVMANDQAVLLAAQSGQLELNFATPLIAYDIFQSAELLSRVTVMFVGCIDGLKVDAGNTKANFERSFGYATALNPYLGYKEVSLLVREAMKKGKSLKQLIIDKGIMDSDDLEKIVATSNGSSLTDQSILKRIKRKP